MAVAACELNVVAGQDHAIRVERRVIVDKELSIAAEVENVAVATDLGDGIVGVVTQQKIIVQVQPPTVRKLIHTPHIFTLKFYYIIVQHCACIHACTLQSLTLVAKHRRGLLQSFGDFCPSEPSWLQYVSNQGTQSTNVTNSACLLAIIATPTNSAHSKYMQAMCFLLMHATLRTWGEPGDEASTQLSAIMNW